MYSYKSKNVPGQSSNLQKAEQDIGNIQMVYTPYVLIVLFALLAMTLRYYLMPQWSIWIHLLLFLYQCLFFLGLWHVIKFINKKLNTLYPFERGALKRISLQNLLTLLCIALYSAISIAISEALGYDYRPDFADNRFMAVMLLMLLVIVFMFNFAFYSLHFFDKWQATVRDKASLEIQAADLQREKSDLQYHQLKNQVNPHYLFNTLSSLEGLISANPELASEFVGHMSKVYRYVLQRKESEVGRLEEELDFITHYIELLHIRYGKGLCIQTQVSPDAQEKGIVTVTLQMLIDNAIKHNVVQSSSPLKICIKDEGDYLIVHNNKQLRTHIGSSNGMGLQQLRQLYAYLTDAPLMVEDCKECYSIKIPLLTLH
uniref:Histidine kinase n=1 Tax=Roseihalotalea indica TaxID=2867963 RepID=A0AA49GKD3_9BACT|nr:histidine kinase [Tunicatimonas sp. TK19036]